MKFWTITWDDGTPAPTSEIVNMPAVVLQKMVSIDPAGRRILSILDPDGHVWTPEYFPELMQWLGNSN